MSLVQGEDWVLMLFNGGLWKPYACARSGNLNVTTNTVGTSAPGTGDWETNEPTSHSFTLSFEGVTHLNESSKLTLPELRALQFAKTPVYIRKTITAQDATVYREEFYAFITNSVDTGSFDGAATFSIEMQGTGAITQIFTPPSPTTGEVFRYPAQGATAPPVTGSTIWSTGLTGKTILNIVKDGRGSNNIILLGTPIGNEALYDSATGDITFAVPFEDGETPPYVEYQN